MSKYVIEKGIQLPPQKRALGSSWIIPGTFQGTLRLMEVGDSVFVDQKMTVASAATRTVRKRHGMKFSCRSVDGGCRVWRIA